MNLSAQHRQQTLRAVADISSDLGVPEAVYVAEHGVSIVASVIIARRWAAHGDLILGDGTRAPLTVTEVVPLAVGRVS